MSLQKKKHAGTFNDFLCCFRLNPFTSDANQIKTSPVEVASEVCEEPNFKTNMSSPSEPSEASSWKRRDLVSMVTFRYIIDTFYCLAVKK